MERSRRNSTAAASAQAQDNLEKRVARSLSAPPSKCGRKKGVKDVKPRMIRNGGNNYTYAQELNLLVKKVVELDEPPSPPAVFYNSFQGNTTQTLCFKLYEWFFNPNVVCAIGGKGHLQYAHVNAFPSGRGVCLSVCVRLTLSLMRICKNSLSL